MIARCTGAAPAVPRQQRRVHVDHAEPRRGEHRIREDLAVSRDDAEVGAKRGQRRPETAGSFKRSGCRTGTPAASARALTGRDRRLVPASARPIRLRDDADDLVARGEQRVERGNGEVRRAEENDPQPGGRYHLPARVSLRIFRTMMSRLMPAQAIDEQRAVEVIHLVLERAREQSRSLDLLWLAVAIEAFQRPHERAGPPSH